MRKAAAWAGLRARVVRGAGGAAGAQVLETVTFDDAVQRAVKNHPTVQQAAAGILRAEAILQQVRARSLPTIDATFSTNVIDPVTQFSGTEHQSADPDGDIRRAECAAADAGAVGGAQPGRRRRRSSQFAPPTKRAVRWRSRLEKAYLAIIVRRRVLELNQLARDNANAHYEYANQRYLGGIGSRLNALRAQQEVSGDDARVEEARLAIRRAQEALGVLIAADGPVDAAEEPTFEVPPPPVPDAAAGHRTARISRRSSRGSRPPSVRADDAWKDYLPSVSALFTPTMLAPTGLFANARSWRATVLFTVPVFEVGGRRGQARERQALVDVVRAERLNAERQAISEIRTAREAVAATERALQFARTAARAGERGRADYRRGVPRRGDDQYRSD